MIRLLIVLLCAGSAFGQAVNRKLVQNSGLYYWGEGTGTSAPEAVDHALGELTGQIAVFVASSFETKVEETNTEYKQSVKQVINTHAAATLRNVQKDVKPVSGGKFEAFCWLKKDEVQAVFDERKELIAEMASKAEDYEAEGNLAHALKLDYFAAILLNSLPDQTVVFDNINYTLEIPKRINAMLDGVWFVFDKEKSLSDKEKEITLRVLYKGRPVSSLDFSFWDGTSQVNVQAKDGYSSFSLFGGSVHFKELKLDIQYANYVARNEFNVVADLWNVVKKPEFPACRKEISLTVNAEPKPDMESKLGDRETGQDDVLETQQGKGEQPNQSMESAPAPVEKVIHEETIQFLNTIEAGDAQKIRSTYASDPFLCDKTVRYVENNRPRVLDLDSEEKIQKSGEGWEIRRIRVLHNYPTITRQSTEYLVLDFDASGRLTDFNTCVNENLYKKFVSGDEFQVDRANRREIVKFLEKYRTAYLTRDLPTVDLMFAEDAIVIVGRKLEKKKLLDDVVRYQPFKNQPDYEYVKLTKGQFLVRLQNVFRTQKDLSLEFGTFNIVKKNDVANVYGVEMRQSYASTGYADEGYLFLLIDFNATDPLIYVRAWQPNAWSGDELIRTANFKVYK